MWLTGVPQWAHRPLHHWRCGIGGTSAACRRGSSLTTAKSNYESTYHGQVFASIFDIACRIINAFLSNCSYFSLLLLTSLIAILPYSPITTLALWGRTHGGLSRRCTRPPPSPRCPKLHEAAL